MPYQDSFNAAVGTVNPVYVAGRWVYNPLYYYEPQDNNVSWAATQLGAASWVFTPFQVPQEAYFQNVDLYVSNSWSATNAGSSRADTVSFSIGIYSQNGSSMSLAVSASATTAYTVTGSTSSNSYQGLKQYPIAINAPLLPGNYFFGVASQVSTAGNAAAGALSNIVYSFAGGQSANKGIFGSASGGSHQVRLGAGVYSASSSVAPPVVGFSELVATNQGNTNNPVFILRNYSA